MSWWTVDRQSYAFNFLASNGLSPYGAAALVSRWKNVESSGGPASVNPSSGAFGIAQWLGSRKSPIAGNTSFDAQLNYVVDELFRSETRAGSLLRNATDEYSGAVGASTYERAEGYDPNTGVDNFTSRTAAGVGEVLRAAGGAVGDAANLPVGDFFGIPFDWGASNQQQPGGNGTWLLVGAIVVIGLIVITR